MKQKGQFLKQGIGVLTGLLCATLVVCGLAEYQKMEGEEERQYEEYYTEDHLTWHDVFILEVYFSMSITPDYGAEIDKNKEPDFIPIEIEPTDETDQTIAFLNHYLFDEFNERDIEGKECAEECGLTYENRITMDWLMAHLAAAANIYSDSPTIQEFMLSERQQAYYDLIKGDTIYTRYQLSYKEKASLDSWFGISLGEPEEGSDEEDQEDYTDMTLGPSEYTHKVVTVMNYILFEEASEKDAKGIEIAKGYGLSKENPLTAEWITTHPREAIEIKNGMENYGGFIYYQSKLLEDYDDIQRFGKMV